MADVTQVQAGDRILVGDHLITLTSEFVGSLEPGDSLVASAQTGLVRRVPAAITKLAEDAVSASLEAFRSLSLCTQDQVTIFFAEAARLMADEQIFETIGFANRSDVEDARKRGRSVTRLELSSKMRLDMIAAFEMWRDLSIEPLSLENTVNHTGWKVQEWRAPLGVIGFVFEGRPNVFADATGVLRSGNTVAFRIGSDALNTAVAIMEYVILPSLRTAGLPEASVVLLASKEHAAGWALFSDTRLSLAVARGSGEAVRELGSIARQSGIPVSLHGTGGAWMLVGEHVDTLRLSAVVEHSLDRKVCNTLNVICVPRKNAPRVVPIIFEAAQRAAAKRNTAPRVHCVGGAEAYLEESGLVEVVRPHGLSSEQQVSVASHGILSHEFEWEENPEFSIVLVDSVDEAIALFNSHSPQFVVSGISESDEELDLMWRLCNAPFMGNGFTRWVDGQFALNRPELGLSNWEFGRLFGRGGVLSGDSAFTVRLRAFQEDHNLAR
jgi:glutamate-5-semialdehyde dehydrogenase